MINAIVYAGDGSMMGLLKYSNIRGGVGVRLASLDIRILEEGGELWYDVWR